MRTVQIGLVGLTIAALWAGGCGGGSPVIAPASGAVPGLDGLGGHAQGGDGPGGAIPDGRAVGQSCSDDAPCRAGLTCESGSCEPSGDSAEGESCVIGAECESGLQCLARTCTPTGTGDQGEACETDADCASGLRCALRGLTISCGAEGTVDTGGDCERSTDCYAGLSCVDGTCRSDPSGLPIGATPSFDEVECDDPVESGETVRALFEVPGASGAAATDFFALPFPTDVRLVDGRPDLEGFPTPGSSLLGYDPLQRYVDAVEARSRGWGANPSVIFRFTGPFQWDWFEISFIDVTPDITVAEGLAANAGWKAVPHGRNNAVCDNWAAVRRPPGYPLTPGHTYAVWFQLAPDVDLAEDGGPVERSPHLEAVLASQAPSNSDLRHAWEAFAPLRDYIELPKEDWMAAANADRIVNATVFTVEPLRDPMAELAAAVEALPTPEASDWVLCDGAAASPCPQAEGDRACGEPEAGYDEYHALLTLPVFQKGTPPYLEEGGGIAAEPVREEPVCMALTVPKGADMPADGWPLVVYAHGTGGSFRSHVRQAVAGTLSNVDLPDGETVHFAVLGIDQVEHGPRRGDSVESPDTLFYNFTNPAAARGNPLQGAADQLALAQFAAALDVDADTTGGDAIRIDPTAIVLFGHSQGATHGSLALPYSSVYSGAVLSGNGGSIKDALLTKTSPVNIAAVIPFALGDPKLSTESGTFGLASGEDHPGLNLLSQWIDPADPLHFAIVAGKSPPEGQAPKHVFQPYGLGDTYAPAETMRVYAVAGRFDEVEAHSSADPADELDINPSEDPLSLPASGNATVDGQEISLLLRQYGPPDGQDGHFVVFDVAAANTDAARFLGMSAVGQVPQVGR